MSKLIQSQIKVSENTTQNVMITAQQIKHDINGNPRYSIQVWVVHEDGGNLWCPKVKGYRMKNDDSYIITTHNLNDSLFTFRQAFEYTVNQD